MIVYTSAFRICSPMRTRCCGRRRGCTRGPTASSATPNRPRQDLLKFYPVDASRTRVIYHGLEPLRPSCNSAGELRRQVRREYLLFVGMRPAYKNFNRLLEAFAAGGLARCMDLLVLGGGRLTVEERSLADKLHISDALVSIPGATDELLAEAYAGAKLFVYPSLCEGFGFPPLEAMAAGCPVAASRTSSLPEVCGDAPWYFDPEDGASMQQALLAAAEDDGWRKVAIARGLAVVARYSWQKCGEQTLAFYRESL